MTKDLIGRDKTNALAERDIFAYGILFIDLLENKIWKIEDRPWLKEIYQVVNPYFIQRYPDRLARKMVVQKSAQCGLSTMGIVRNLHFADYWDIRSFYMLPRERDVLDFTGTRIDPMIARSPRLAKKLGTPNSGHVKRLGNSYLFFMEASVEPRMMPADILMVDEVDLSDQTNIAVAVNRMNESVWKLEYYYSTPTVPNYGINAIFNNSDKREWMIKCRKCGLDQVLDWDKNLFVLGPRNNPTKVFYGCAKCHEELTLQDDIWQGRWVAEHPGKSQERAGFHVSQMYICDAGYLYSIFIDPQTKLYEFYRMRLGKPYELGGGSLEREDIIVNCFDEPYDVESNPDPDYRYYMGIDQGNQLQIIIGKIPKEGDDHRIRIVHIELVPFDIGFTRAITLMRLFKIKRCVSDANPNRHPVRDMQKVFPAKVIMADYVDQRERVKYHKDKDLKTITRLTMNRTEAFDNLFSSVRKGDWLMPGNPSSLSPMIELLIDHLTALKRDIQIHKIGMSEVQVGVYVNIRADHLAHAMLNLQNAVDLDHRKRKKMRAISVGKPDDDEEEEIDENAPPDETIKGIISFLAEVPIDQLSGYITKAAEKNYQIPFPLSYKLQRSLEFYEMKDILWVMEYMVVRAKEKHVKSKRS